MRVNMSVFALVSVLVPFLSYIILGEPISKISMNIATCI